MKTLVDKPNGGVIVKDLEKEARKAVVDAAVGDLKGKKTKDLKDADVIALMRAYLIEIGWIDADDA